MIINSNNKQLKTKTMKTTIYQQAKMELTYYVIAIYYGQSTEYWNSALVNDENTTKNVENAEGFETIEAAQKELENAVKPFGVEKCWNVSYSIDEV